MTLIIFVIFPLDIICILGLTLKKISYCLTNLYSVSNPTVDVFSHFISPNLEEKKFRARFSKHSFSLYCISLFFLFFNADEQSTPTLCICSSNPLSSLYLYSPLFAQQCTGSITIFSFWTHHLTFAHTETHQQFLQPFP